MRLLWQMMKYENILKATVYLKSYHFMLMLINVSTRALRVLDCCSSEAHRLSTIFEYTTELPQKAQLTNPDA